MDEGKKMRDEFGRDAVQFGTDVCIRYWASGAEAYDSDDQQVLAAGSATTQRVKGVIQGVGADDRYVQAGRMEAGETLLFVHGSVSVDSNMIVKANGSYYYTTGDGIVPYQVGSTVVYNEVMLKKHVGSYTTFW